MGYCDYTNQWLRDLTRQRRVERREAVARPQTLRFGPTGEVVEFSILDAAPVGLSGGRRNGAYKVWKRDQWLSGNRRCYYCGVHMTIGVKNPDGRTLDHKEPLALGGPDIPTNWCMCCVECNGLKGMMTEGEFRALLASIDASLISPRELVALLETGDLPEAEVPDPRPLKQEDAEHDNHYDGGDRLNGGGHGDVGGHQIPDRPDHPQHDDEPDDVHAALTG